MLAWEPSIKLPCGGENHGSAACVTVIVLVIPPAETDTVPVLGKRS